MWGNSKDAHFSPSRDFIPQSTEKELVKTKSQCVWTYLPIESEPCSKKFTPQNIIGLLTLGTLKDADFCPILNTFT
jgi:hypothetical protein